MATETKTKKKRPSYRHKNPRRLMTATLEQFVAMDRAAKAEGLTWNQFALAVLLAKIKYVKREEAAGRR